jgi:hypothetical protein
MTDDSKIIDAKDRFRDSRKEDDQKEGRQRDGAVVLRKMERRGAKLSPEDREKVARSLGRYMRYYGIDRTTLANDVDMDNKEIYRLTLKAGEDAVYNRLRADANKYACLITAIAKRAAADKYLLANSIAYGTSLHPSSEPSHSDIEWIMRRVYELVDGLEDEFRLLATFEDLSRMKATRHDYVPDAYWPFSFDESEAGLSSDELREYTSTFWPESEHASATLDIDNPNWPNIIGYLPHFYFGLDGNFDFDPDYWLLPESVKKGDYTRYAQEVGTLGAFALPLYDKEEEATYPEMHRWRRHIREKLLETIADASRLTITRDETGEILLFNAEPSNVFIRRLQEFKYQVLLEATPHDDPTEGQELPKTEISALWLAVYPNPAMTGLVPVLISANEYYGTEISLFTEERLQKLAGFTLIGDETLGTQLMRALQVTSDEEEPRLLSEWRRTAGFIQYHPLLKQLAKMQAAERYIRKWRERVSTQDTAKV